MNVLIVEDEPHTACLLQEVIEQDKNFIVLKILESITETTTFLLKYQQNIDLIFLDISLSDGHSFEIFRQIDVSTPVVFCTAYDAFTLQAIKNNGIDYILKPFKESEIHAALNRFKLLVGNIQSKFAPVLPIRTPQVSETAYQESFLTQHREKSVVVYTKDIALFSIEHEIVYLYTFDGKKSAVFKNLEYIEMACDPRLFFRLNRQMLVNRDNIISMEPYFNRKVVLHLKVHPPEKVVVSRLKVSPLKEWIEKG